MAGRVSIPAGVRRTIQDIKEIAGNFSDEEVYAVLRECAMDPNETTQKLLHQDPFHEVKRKRDKKKESNKEITDSRWRPGIQGRGGRFGRGIYSPRPSDFGGRNVNYTKENGVAPKAEKANGSCAVASIPQPTTSIIISSSSVSLMNGQHQVNVPAVEDESVPTSSVVQNLGPTTDGDLANNVGATDPSAFSATEVHSVHDISQVPTVDSAGTAVDAMGNFTHGQLIVDVKSQNDRDSHDLGSDCKVDNKEWKPKPMAGNCQSPAEASDDLVDAPAVGKAAQSILESSPMTSGNRTSKVEKMFSEMHLSDRKCVIIPNHFQVSDSVKCGLNFGSFETSFDQNIGFSNGACGDVSTSATLSESSLEDEAAVEETVASDHINLLAVSKETMQIESQQKSLQLPKQDAPEDVEPGTAYLEESVQHKETDFSPEVSYPVVQTVPSYQSLDLPSIANQFSQLDSSEPLTQDNIQSHHIMAQQQADFSAAYYSQLYRSHAESDGRLSPFVAPGAIKYGNISVLPMHTAQAPQEGSAPVVIPSSGSTLPTQPAGVHSSVAIPQQPIPMFRHAPAGVQMPHYPPHNFIPYNTYFPPFYVPTPTLHHFLSNTAFPQQASTGGIYPVLGSAQAAPPVKSSTPQLKPNANTGNQTHVGIPSIYTAYAPSPATTPPVTSNSLAENGDGITSQYKDSNLYMTGQQVDGQYVWVSGPGREVPGIQASPFYGLHPQGQQMAFAQAQAGHGVFGGVYHPSQTVPAAAVHQLLQPQQTVASAVEMAGAAPNTYQQAQRAQLNWSNNY